MIKNSKIITALVIFLIVLAAIFYFNNSVKNLEGATVSRSEFLMDTIVDLKVHGPKAEEAVKASFEKLEAVENKMSKTIKKSDVYQINKNAAQKWVKIEQSTFQVIQKAVEYAQKTDGKFDPTISPLVELWGIGTEKAKIPETEQIKKAKALVDYNNLKLDSNNYKVKFAHSGMGLDLGAIAKGYAADEVYKILKSYGIKSALINLGGNVLTLGTKKDGSRWKIGIQDPRRQRGSVMAALELTDQALVTSGNYERYFEKEGVIYHHIISPETGKPARNNLLSVSIITENSFAADALSTSVYMMGLNRGSKLVESLAEVEAIFVTEANQLYLSSGLKGKVEILNSDFKAAEFE